MATVTGFTAERMLVIENTTVVDGDIVGDNLILKTREGTTIDAGNVRGPVGPVGPAGPVNPPGVIMMFAGSTAPTGYLMCDGASVSRTTYPALFATIGTAYGSVDASTFSLPDMKNKFAVGMGPDGWSDTLNEKGGSKDATLPSHSHGGGAHAHSVDIWSGTQNANHAHGFNVNTGPANVDHSHNTPGFVGTSFGRAAGGTAMYVATEPQDNQPTTGFSTNHLHSVSGGTDIQNTNHAHPVNGATSAVSVTTDAQGASPTNANLPPYITVNYIIKT